MVEFWKYLTFIQEAERDGRAARARTEIFCKQQQKIRERLESISRSFKYPVEKPKNRTLDEWM